MYDSAAGRSESGHHKTTSSRHCEHDRKRGDKFQPPVAAEWVNDHPFLIFLHPHLSPPPEMKGAASPGLLCTLLVLLKFWQVLWTPQPGCLERLFVSSSFLPLHTSASGYVSSTTNIAPGPWLQKTGGFRSWLVGMPCGVGSRVSTVLGSPAGCHSCCPRFYLQLH